MFEEFNLMVTAADPQTYNIPSTLLSGDGVDIVLACLQLGVDRLRAWSDAVGNKPTASAEDINPPTCFLLLIYPSTHAHRSSSFSFRV